MNQAQLYNLIQRTISIWLAFVLSTWLVLLPLRTSTAQGVPYRTVLVGNSSQGKAINAYLFGTGNTKIALVGGVHAGDEVNSTALINKAIDYFSQNGGLIPPDLTLILIPNANPDGTELNTRTNARKVDLNRNWATPDWQPDTYTVDGELKNGGGTAPFSEPETAALWRFFQNQEVISVIWYHSQGGLVVDTAPTANEQRYASYLGRLLAASTGYAYKQTWTAYALTGDASDFLNSKGIYSLTIELTNHTDVDWTQNLRGFSTLLSFFRSRQFPPGGAVMSGRLLAYWSSNGSEKLMGNPLGNAQTEGERLWQQLERGTLTLDTKGGLVGWLPGAKAPAPDAAAIASAPPPLPVAVVRDPTAALVTAYDAQSARLRQQLDDLQAEAQALQKELDRLNARLRQPVPTIAAPARVEPPPPDVPKAVKAVLGPNSTATVYAYEKGKVIRTMGAFSGAPGFETPRGEFKLRYKNPLLKTNVWYENDGTEYFLKFYASFTGSRLNYSDDWAFHQMRIPVSGAAAGQMQSGPSHGCLALTPTDAEWLFKWGDEGTPVSIY